MMKKLLLLCLSGFLSLVFANIGKISVSKGDVTVIRNNTTLSASNNFILEKLDQIKTGADGKAQLIFSDNTLITIGAKSLLNVSEYVFDEQNQKAQAQFNVVEGTFRTITGKIGKTNPDKFKLQTKSASIGIRGTVFGGDENKVFCEDGQIAVNSNGIEVIVNKDQIIEVSNNQAPSTPRAASKQEKEEVKENSGSNDPDMQQNEQKVVEQKNSDTTAKEEAKEEKSNTQEQATDETSGEEGSFEATPTPTPQETPNIENVIKNVEKTKAAANDVKKQDVLVITKDDEESDVGEPDVDEPFYFSTYTTQEGLEFEYVTKSGTTLVNTNTYYSQFQITPTLFTSTQSVAQLEYKIAPQSAWIDLGEIILSKNSQYSYNELQELIVPFTAVLADEIESFPYDYTLKIVFDNKGEFFTVHANTIDSDFTHYDLGYSGTQANTSLLLEPSILHYTPNYLNDEFASNLQTFDGNGAGRTGMSGKEYYLNTANNNGYLASYFWDYGQIFTVLRVDSDGGIIGKTYENLSNLYSVNSNISGSLFGSELQGLGLNILDGYTFDDMLQPYTTYQQINTAYLKENMEILNPQVGNETQWGYLIGVGKNSTNPIENLALPFEFTIDKSLGNFNAANADYSIDTYNDYLQAYYIDASKFGSLFTSMTQGAYTLVSEKGWFFTIPDTLNEDDFTYSYDNDDYSSWGYWTATLQDSNNDLLQYTNSSTWVAGVTTPTDTIDFLLNTSKPTYTFNGQVLGNVINGTNFTPIDLNSQNNISLTINFSNPSVTGTIGFTSNYGNDTWSANTTTSGVTNSNFTAGLSGTVGANTTTGSLEGKYYGPNLQSVGGKFQLTSTGGDVASGVFKAKK